MAVHVCFVLKGLKFDLIYAQPACSVPFQFSNVCMGFRIRSDDVFKFQNCGAIVNNVYGIQ